MKSVPIKVMEHKVGKAEGRKIKCTEHVQKEQNITGTVKRECKKITLQTEHLAKLF
jgi:hypothetical protein